MSTQPMIRGYSLRKTAEYIRTDRFDSSTRARILTSLPEHLRGDLTNIDVVGWYPREDSIALFQAIASVSSDEAEARQTLRMLGEFIAEESTNTFLKLVMRLLNPVRFAAKLPSLWDRDMRGGNFTYDVSGASEKRMEIYLNDVAGYDHIGAVTEGWIHFAMRSLGEHNARVELRGWSLETPGPERVEYLVSWA